MTKVQQKSEKISAFGGIFFVLDKFDLAAWLLSLKYSWSRVASFYIFLYFGSVNSAESFILVAVIKFTCATNSRLIFIL